MSSNNNNKSKSKKKKKFSARQLQHVNADRKKFGVLRSSESSRPPTASSEVLLSSPSPTVLPSNFNQLLPKHKKFNAVSDSNIIMDIRSLPKDAKDMLPTIQKQVLNNFATSYNIQKKQARPSRSNSSTNTPSNSSIIEVENNIFHVSCGTYRRCLIEDYMIIPSGTKVMVLVPSTLCNEDSIWTTMKNSNFKA